MVGPQDDDGVFRVRTFIQGIEEQADHRVRIGDRRQVALDTLAPLIGRQDLRVVVPAAAGDLDALVRDIPEVVFEE